MPVTSLTDEYMARLHMELGPLIPSVDEVSSHEEGSLHVGGP